MPVAHPINWPSKLLTPAGIAVKPTSQSRSGGQSTSGVEQVVVSPAFRWSIKLSGVPLWSRDKVLAWRAIEGQLDGRTGTVLVPIFDFSRSPAGPPVRVPFADGSPFDDTSLFRSNVTEVVIGQGATLNATQIAVTWPAGGLPPQPGQHFSIGDQGQTEMHRVIAVDALYARSATLTIRPWLRATWPAQTPLEFDDPRCLCRLAADNGMDASLDLWRFSNPDVEFVEAF